MTKNKKETMIIMLQLLTLVRIPIAAALAAILIYSDKFTFDVVALSIILISLIELTDFLDGFMARKNNIVTEWGAMLDPYADSISRLIVYWGFACSGLVIALVPMAMAFRDITVAYCRITLTRFGQTVSAKQSGKIKAVFQGVGAILIVLGPLYWDFIGRWPIYVLSWLIIIVTLASMIEYAQAAISTAIRETKKNN